MLINITCAVCGASAIRSTASRFPLYCSNACKARAYRARRDADLIAERERVQAQLTHVLNLAQDDTTDLSTFADALAALIG